MDVREKLGDSSLNGGRIIRLFDRPDPFSRAFVLYLIALCNRPETASEVVSGRFVCSIVPDKCVKFRDPRLNRSREIPPGAIGGGILTIFFALTSDRKQL